MNLNISLFTAPCCVATVMIKDPEAWRAWEDEYIRSRPADYQRNLKVFEAMYEHARRLGVFASQDPLEGIEFKTRLARDLNALRTA
jgi:hypothetical protein